MNTSRLTSGRRPVVLHVVESFATGVATAVRSYAQGTPECEHHLLYSLRSESTALDAGWSEEFASVHQLSGGHVRKIVQTRRTIRLLKPDVVHSHSSFGGAYARLAARKSKSMRQIHTPHYWNFDREDCKGWVRMAFWGVEGLLALNTDIFAGCSRAENRSARWGPLRPPTVFVPNVPASEAKELGSRAERTPLVVAAAGRLSLQKDPQFFLHCLEVLRAEGLSVHPVWIGGGDDDLEELLRAAGVEVTGWLTHAEALARLREIDIYWHTARWEGFPLMVLEAVAAGIPVVVRRIPAFADVALPAFVDVPDDVKSLWPMLSGAGTRARMAEMARLALWENNPRVQHDRLLDAYGVTTSGSGGAPISSEGKPLHSADSTPIATVERTL